MRKISLFILIFVGVLAGFSRAQANEDDMILYRAGSEVPQSELMDLGDIGAIGGEILRGNPVASARFDYVAPGYAGGVFQVTRGVIRVTYPFTEHATILNGIAKITDEEGNEAILMPGDSYLITQGSTVVVTVLSAKLQKSFYNYHSATDNPGPMAIFKRFHAVPDDDFMILDPAGIGGEVVSGNPIVSARFDVFVDSLVGGVFQVTHGGFEITMPFTEHGGINKGISILRVGDGPPQLVLPGDSYLIKKGAELRWDAIGTIQKTFLNLTLP